MAKNIILDSASLSAAILAAKLTVSGIDTDRDVWIPQGESSIALEAFTAQFAALEDVMALYQSLLLRDLDAAAKVGKELVLSDLNLTTFWK